MTEDLNNNNSSAAKILIIVPTYNEKENIQNLCQEIFKKDSSFNILVVDDNSPDGTAEIVRKMQAEPNPKLHLLLRKNKAGLGRAYLAGFDWGLKQGFDVLVEMDADFSHSPDDLIRLIDVIRQKDSPDFLVGSRYVKGGRTENWGLIRKLISRGGSLYSRFILFYPINDWTGGFIVWKKQVLQHINLETVTSNGYSFQIELKYRALKAGFKGQEVPILFKDRRVGQSKMSFKIVIEALYRVWILRFK